MRRLVLFIVMSLLLGASVLSAQVRKGTVSITPRQNLVNVLPEDVVYWFADFQEATVFYRNGTQTTAVVNFCNVDRQLHFIGKEGDTLTVGNVNDIHEVLVGDMLFVRIKDRFLQTLVKYGSVRLVEEREFAYETFDDVPDAGPLAGSPTGTQQRTRVSSVISDRATITSESEVKVDWKLEIRYLLVQDGKTYLAKKSSFDKVFKEKKDFIRTFVKSNDTDFSKKEDVVSLFWYCTEN